MTSLLATFKRLHLSPEERYLFNFMNWWEWTQDTNTSFHSCNFGVNRLDLLVMLEILSLHKVF
jgi:hypothetical protein